MNNGKVDKLFGGGYSGNIQGNTTITINSGSVKEIFGGGYAGSIGGDTNIFVKSGNFENIFGGCDQSYVTGNTQVKVGNEEDLGVTVTGLVYGGGRGIIETGKQDASDYITVYKTSTVIIQGLNTQVKNYGSTKLGKVAGNVDVTFKDYKVDNPTAKYKTMNGIDRATTVTFDNSYVLLENKDENGNLEGIKAIENLIIPEESGLKISADGEITGNFVGGGELYLDSAVCLTVKGDITGSTRLVLNPKLIEDVSKIVGGIENPYMRVLGNSEATNEEKKAQSLISGEDRYEILTKKYISSTDSTNTQWSHYYISGDIEITDYISESLVNIAGKLYTGNILETNDAYILNNRSFTNDTRLEYAFLDDNNKEDKYKNITKEIVLKDSNKELQEIPAGTEIVMIQNDEYYKYIVPTNTTEISLGNFTKFTDGTNYSGNFDITTIPKENITVNEATQYKTYSYSETYRFIVNFSNCINYMNDGTYYLSLNLKDAGISIGEEQEENTNMIQISSRNYNYEYTLDKEKYESDGVINVNGILDVNAINSNITGQVDKDLLAIIKLEKVTEGQNVIVNIPVDSILTINDKDHYEVTNGRIEAKILENKITNSAITTNLKIALDMSNVLQQNRLQPGNYKLSLDFVLSENSVLESLIQKSIEVPFTIFEYDEECGISVEIINDLQIEEDKIQLITKGLNEERTLSLKYGGTLEEPKIKVTSLEKTGAFEYINTTNSKDNIKVKVSGQEVTEIANLANTQNVVIEFENNIQPGTYRVLFELYDKYGTKKTECLVNFIVVE